MISRKLFKPSHLVVKLMAPALSWLKGSRNAKEHFQKDSLNGERKVGKLCKQGSHSHGKSGKIMEKFMVLESHGKVMEYNKNIKSHGKVKIFPNSCSKCSPRYRSFKNCPVMSFLWKWSWKITNFILTGLPRYWKTWKK